MSKDRRPRLAILYPGDRAARDRAEPAESRFLKLFTAFAGAVVVVDPAAYDDDFRDEERPAGRDEKYVLCEVNVSSVSPFS